MRDGDEKCAEITSLSIDSAPESTGVTDFVQEACQATEVFGKHSAISSIFPKDNKVQELTEYFRRPVAITAGTLSTAVRLPIYNLDFTGGSIINSFSGGLTRLTGVYGVRFTAVFTLQVAATPFHQGILAMNWQYAISQTTGSGYEFKRFSSSQTCTNIPHVRCDLSTDTMVQLRVPFMYPYEYFPLVGSSNAPPYGIFAINTLTPIPTVSGISAPGYQVYLHLEDLEFFGATPQTTTTVTLQSGKKLAPISEEFEDESRPFSSATHALSKVVRYAAKGVPLLSSIGGPTSWFLEKTAGALRSFGFSRPQVVDPVMRIVKYDTIGEHNVDVPNSGLVCGPLASNQLRVSPKFAGTDVDEMSLKYVLSQYSQIQNFPITTSSAVGSLLYVTPVSPCAMWFRTGGTAPYCNVAAPTIAPAGTNCFNPSGLFYFSQMFKYWKGSMKFRFTFSKTKMHGGRVMIAYLPYDDTGYELDTLGYKPTIPIPAYGVNGPDPFGISAVFNLRDGNVFEFEVPYLSARPFLNFANDSGSLVMYVVDALQAPSVVAQSINVMVEVCAGADFELANVRPPLYPPAFNGTVTLQSGKVLSNTKEDVSEYTVGESISSLKQLIMIPKTTWTSVTAGTLFNLWVPPWYTQPVPSASTTAPTAHLTESFGFGGCIAACFAFVKGGTDFHAYANQGNGSNMYLVIRQAPANVNTTTTQTPAQAPYSASPRVINSSGCVLHARLPSYQTILRYPAWVIRAFSAIASAWGANGVRYPATPTPYQNGFMPPALYVFSMLPAATGKVMTSRAASDDAACGLYMGPPQCLLLSTNTAATLYDVDSDTAIM